MEVRCPRHVSQVQFVFLFFLFFVSPASGRESVVTDDVRIAVRLMQPPGAPGGYHGNIYPFHTWDIVAAAQTWDAYVPPHVLGAWHIRACPSCDSCPPPVVFGVCRSVVCLSVRSDHSVSTYMSVCVVSRMRTSSAAQIRAGSERPGAGRAAAGGVGLPRDQWKRRRRTRLAGRRRRRGLAGELRRGGAVGGGGRACYEQGRGGVRRDGRARIWGEVLVGELTVRRRTGRPSCVCQTNTN